MCVCACAVYTQAVSRVMQVVMGPMLHFLQEETARNRQQCQELLKEKEELTKTLHTLTSSNDQIRT